MRKLWMRQAMPATLLWLTFTGFLLLAFVLPALFRVECGPWSSCGGIAA